jgi:molybdopterin-guanine dinucleotide biosynthesis protein B
MTKIVGVIGYKDSGKTTLVRALVRELTDRGHRVAVVKHTSHRLDLPGKDSAILGEAVDQVGIVSPRESAVFWKKPLSLEDITSHMEADIILVEGFKSEQTHPKIACLRGQPDDRDLFDDLTIAAVGLADQVEIPDVPLFGRDEVGQIAGLVEQVEVET